MSLADHLNSSNCGEGTLMIDYFGGLPSSWPNPCRTGPTHADLSSVICDVYPCCGGTPAVAMQSQRLDVFSRGADNYLWQTWWQSGYPWTWYKIADGSGVSRPMASTASAVSWASGRLDVFFRGPDHHLWQAWWEGGGWNWYDLGGDIASAPSAITRGVGRIDVFARGPGNVLFLRRFDAYASGWEDWRALIGGTIASAPAAVSWGYPRYDVFVRDNNNGLYQVWSDGGMWTWYPLTAPIASSPAAASWGYPRLDVFARKADNTVFSASFNESGWSILNQGGGTIIQPGAEAWNAFGTNRADAFIRWTDNSLRQKYYNGTWQPSGTWANVGSGILSPPAPVSWGPDRIDVFGRGSANQLRQIWWQNGFSWTPADLGGVLHSGC